MKLKHPIQVVNVFVMIVGLGVFSPGCNQLDFVSIGTGAVTGIYYPTGGAICRMINKKMDTYHIKATVESTAGSVYNVNAVLSGDLEFGVVQSDRQYQAFHGLSEWKDKGPQKNLRSVFSIHPESVTLIASVDCGATEITELKGKRVNIGNPGSGPLQNARDALEAFGLDEKKDIIAEYVKAVEAPGLLQDERIDAFFYTVGHPNGNIKEATSGRVRVRIIKIAGSSVDELVKKFPYYTKAEVPCKFYPNAENKEDVATFGVRGTLVTSVNVDEKIVYAITKEIFENFEVFKSLHPAYAVLTKKSMLTGLSAPIHRGALRYYRESNLIQYIDKKLAPPDTATSNQKLLQGDRISESVGQWVSGSVRNSLIERSLVISHWSLVSEVSKVSIVSELRRLKASIPVVQATFHQLHNIRHFDAFAAVSIHLKKPSVGPKGLIGPPCHGAPGGRRQ